MSKRYNIREYHRPTDLNEAKRLLGRKTIHSVPLAGGVKVVGEASPDIEAVVDLDGLGLDFIDEDGGVLRLGAMVRLQAIIEKLADRMDGLLAEAARRTAGWHVRNSATVGGTLAGGDVHSPLGIALAALTAHVVLDGKKGDIPLWVDLSKEIQHKGLKGHLITAIEMSLHTRTIGASYRQIGRTSADRPIVSAAAVAIESGQGIEATVAVGGLLHDLTVFTQQFASGKTNQVIDDLTANISTLHKPESEFQSDFLGSAEYRREVAPILARRALLDALNRLNQSSS